MAEQQPEVTGDELGAHVSAAGGVPRAPARATEIGAVVLQLFTKQPQRWAERQVDEEMASDFREERERHDIRLTVSHDSYLINLATPDATLFERSYAAFRGELERCAALGVEYLVTHPGNATDGDAARGIAQNADAVGRALKEVGGETVVLLETTAGSGTSLGSTFRELGQLRQAVPRAVRERVAVCLDTCHVWAAGYNLDEDYEDVFARFDDAVGLDSLRLFHFNDSQGELGSNRDRHAHIGQGTLGDGPFRRIMRDERFTSIPKLLETPKDGDAEANDRMNLARLRAFRS